MDITQAIQCYNAEIDQEVKDKEMFLRYINTFQDVLTRQNEIAHFTSSAFVVNKERTKILMIYHNIYNSWGWVGGHADGEADLLAVAIREVEEETGVKSIKVLDHEISAIDTLPVLGHVKRGKYIPAHIHLSVAYLLEADENEVIRIKADENSNVGWIEVEKVIELCTEDHMKPLYSKLIKNLMEI